MAFRTRVSWAATVLFICVLTACPSATIPPLVDADAVATDSARSEASASDTAQDAVDSPSADARDALDSTAADSQASDSEIATDGSDAASDGTADAMPTDAATDSAPTPDAATDSAPTPDATADATPDADAQADTTVADAHVDSDAGSAAEADADAVTYVTAPLISSIAEGADATGQIQVVGIGYYIAAYGVYPSQGGTTANSTGSPYIAQVLPFASNFAPAGWLPCDGSLLSIPNYEVLFNLIGTTYGGDGVTTFGVPNLQARVPMGVSAAGSPPNAAVPAGVSEVPLVSTIALGGTAQGQVQALGLNYYIATAGVFPSQGGSANVTGPYLGQIMSFAGTFAPSGWALCDGSLLPINSNAALFSVLGTTFGGDGRTNFALPDLRGRIALATGTLAQFTAPPTSSTHIPTITTITLGGTAQGQVNAQGINYYITSQGVFPSRDGTSTSVNMLAEITLFAGDLRHPGGLPATDRCCQSTRTPRSLAYWVPPTVATGRRTSSCPIFAGESRSASGPTRPVWAIRTAGSKGQPLVAGFPIARNQALGLLGPLERLLHLIVGGIQLLDHVPHKSIDDDARRPLASFCIDDREYRIGDFLRVGRIGLLE